ncbi:MAG TPA: DUF4332 domain-containing protein [Candidatus Thermoplasmatota archaeon]|nr:DUF4332 domain-containing protein [Candidatus Thermoplasmatota archaeon]
MAPIPLPRLELVTEPGPVKRLHWDAEAGARAQGPAEAAARPSPLAANEAPPPRQAATPEPQAELQAHAPRLVGRRRTLYTTDHGNQVVAYERDGRRQLAITEPRGGRLEEVPFDEAQVDRVIGQAEPAAPAEGQQASPAKAKPRRFFFLRRRQATAAPAAGAPVAEHVDRPADVVQPPPGGEAIAKRGPAVDAWEPGAAPRGKAQERTRAPRRRTARQPQRAYAGDNHPVIDIEGIGPVHARKLERMGITTTGLLAVARPGRIARGVGVPAKTVRTWQAEAELLKVRGIGPQFAEALARAGVTGIDELKRRSAQEVAQQVAQHLDGLDATVVGQPVTPRRVAAWKRKAKPMRRVKVDRTVLAAPNHGLPPPWLRENAKPAKKAVRRKANEKVARKVRRSR